VVGGGIIAERKARLLLRCHAPVIVVSPTVTIDLQRLIDQGQVSHLCQRFSDELAARFWLVIAATDDDVLNRRVASAADDAGRLCNVVDDDAASTFILPAIVDRSPVVIAIGTEGNAPVLAQQLKTRIEAWLPARIGELAEKAGRWRNLVKKRYASLRDRRRFWQRFFSGPIAEHILAGRQAAADRAMRAELIGADEPQGRTSGEAWIVGAGPGDPGLVTLRAQQLISQADVVLYDRLVSKPVLDYARKEVDLIYVGKEAGAPTMSQEEINALLVRLVRAGERVCRLKGGDPFVFGRGGEEALALARAGLPFQIVPGITAAVGCAAYAGIPLTLRGVSAGVTLATARLDDDIGPDWRHLLNSGHTLALYMGVSAIPEIGRQLHEADLPDDLPIAIVENGTTEHQRTIHTSVVNLRSDAVGAGVQSPAMLFIGKAIANARELQWFEQPPANKHESAFAKIA
jgi:uroporphyrin-III C-methyltransferase/precorrin-2 dehydrogenase/sirohydrochlorin ferrochelatase